MLEFHQRIATKTTLHSIVTYKINEKQFDNPQLCVNVFMLFIYS